MAVKQVIRLWSWAKPWVHSIWQDFHPNRVNSDPFAQEPGNDGGERRHEWVATEDDVNGPIYLRCTERRERVREPSLQRTKLPHARWQPAWRPHCCTRQDDHLSDP